MLTEQDVSVKEDGDASNIILTDSSLIISDDATITVSDVKAADVCVKGNDCNANAVIAAGKNAGLVVKRVGSRVAYDMVGDSRSAFFYATLFACACVKYPKLIVLTLSFNCAGGRCCSQQQHCFGRCFDQLPNWV